MLRFATEKFSVEDEDLANIFIHLTNFTVNKNGELNCDFPPGCQVEQDYMSPEAKDFTIKRVGPSEAESFNC